MKFDIDNHGKELTLMIMGFSIGLFYLLLLVGTVFNLCTMFRSLKSKRVITAHVTSLVIELARLIMCITCILQFFVEDDSNNSRIQLGVVFDTLNWGAQFCSVLFAINQTASLARNYFTLMYHFKPEEGPKYAKREKILNWSAIVVQVLIMLFDITASWVNINLNHKIYNKRTPKDTVDKLTLDAKYLMIVIESTILILFGVVSVTYAICSVRFIRALNYQGFIMGKDEMKEIKKYLFIMVTDYLAISLSNALFTILNDNIKHQFSYYVEALLCGLILDMFSIGLAVYLNYRTS